MQKKEINKENLDNNDLYLDNLLDIRNYFSILIEKITKVTGIFDILFAERLLNFAKPGVELNSENLQEIIFQITYLDGLIESYTTSTKEEKINIIKSLGLEANRKANALNRYLEYLKNSKVKSVLSNCVPFKINIPIRNYQIETIVEKTPAEIMDDLDLTVNAFNEEMDKYLGPSFIKK